MDNFLTILPPASSSIEKSLDEVADKVVSVDLAQFAINPKTCNKKLLPFLASQLSLNLGGLNEKEQRTLLANVKNIYKHQGTPWAVETALSSVFKKAELVEFKQPHVFSAKVLLKGETYQNSDFKKAKKLIDVAKNARSTFTGFTQSTKADIANIDVTSTLRFQKKQKLSTHAGIAQPLLSICLVNAFWFKQKIQLTGGFA